MAESLKEAAQRVSDLDARARNALSVLNALSSGQRQKVEGAITELWAIRETHVPELRATLDAAIAGAEPVPPEDPHEPPPDEPPHDEPPPPDEEEPPPHDEPPPDDEPPPEPEPEPEPDEPPPDSEEPPPEEPGGPTASFVWAVREGTTVWFDGTVSTPGASDITGYSWQLDADHPAISAPSGQWTYPAPGTYAVTLTVTDEAGLTDSVTQDVVIEEEPVVGEPPPDEPEDPVDPVDPVEPGTPPVGGGLHFWDDFSSGDLTKSMNGFRWGLRGNQLPGPRVSVAINPLTGRPALRQSYRAVPPGADNAVPQQRFRIAAGAATAPRELWIRKLITVPENFTIREGEAPHNHKWLAIWAEDYTGAGDAKMVVEFFRLNVGVGEGRIRYAACSGAGETKAIEQTMPLKGLLIDAADRGTQIEVCHHIRIGTVEGANGVADTWKNGRLVGQLRSPWIMAEGQGRDYFRNGYLLGWANAGYGEETVWYLDRIEFHTSRPEDWPT